MGRNQSFPKPTGIALGAAFFGVLIHLAVFFLVRIQVETPTEMTAPENALSYWENQDPETIALIDPLTLLVASDRDRSDPGLEDFRTLSISREITTFPPFLSIENSREWNQWVPEQSVEENAEAWLLERNASSLRDFGRSEIPDLTLASDQMTLQIINLQSREVQYLNLPLPPEIQLAAEETSFLSPSTFLLDRSSAHSFPPAMRVSSSGYLAVDQALRKVLTKTDNGLPRKYGYFEITIYLPTFLPQEP